MRWFLLQVLVFTTITTTLGMWQPLTVSYKFKRRHIRQGSCLGVTKAAGYEQLFRQNLYETAESWPEFAYTDNGERRLNTFILSRKKTQDEIARCIEHLADQSLPGKVNAQRGTGDITIKMGDFLSTCKFPDIQLAVMKGIAWYPDDVYVNECWCGQASFTVSYIINTRKIIHYAGQANWQGNPSKCD